MTRPPGPRPGNGTRLLLGSAGLLLLAGALIIGLALFTFRSTAKLPAVGLGGGRASIPLGRAAGAQPAKTRCPSVPAAGPGPAARPLPYSAPVEVAIPAICVLASVIPLGENPDGTAAVPPLTAPWLTSWFDEGPAPGQAGPAALYGHVDTAAAGPAVFYRIGDLAPGDIVNVTRADHVVAVFTVYRVAEYPKSTFPTMTVYGDTPGSELRLITCGGPFDAAAGSYLDSIVVYARLTAVS